MKPSTLIRTFETGAEQRYCGECGEWYILPIPYEKANQQIRDLCPECIARLQREHEDQPRKEEVGPEWYS